MRFPVTRMLFPVLVAAALVAGAQPAIAQPTPTPTPAPAATICNRYCDARDPSQAGGDRVPVTAGLSGRTLSLHLADGDPMGWAAIDQVRPGDEVWLDRSFDAGATWEGRLGVTTAPQGFGGWRTQMYNNDDWNNRGVGALRACGRAVDTGAIACTQWARTTWNAANRTDAAATALMALYDNTTGYFRGGGFWGSAVALTGVIRNAAVTNLPSYRYAIATTYERNVNAGRGHFRNEFSDDTGWWAMAWLDAHALTGEQRYLDTARIAADHMHTFWTGACGGGIRWKEGSTYKASISNSLYVQVNATLAARAGETRFRDRALAGWSWFAGTGLIGGDNLVRDGLDESGCAPGGTVFTYNQGVLMSGLTALSALTGDPGPRARARQVADATTRPGSPLTDSSGVLHDPAEGWDDCLKDGAYFKAGLARGLAELNAAVSGGPYTAYLDRQADTAYSRSRNAFDQYSLSWSAWTRPAGPGCQASALAVLNATH
ncbi:glycoside hydrolase family 76 protein [Actinophytocola xinjiangensis]|nr:glycoside hydrolase family 76 protein [Actinophytocola xinjiangensis]